jgi:flagellar biosynthesis/type III secretory pathway M-ring protein FliF/YscJ
MATGAPPQPQRPNIQVPAALQSRPVQIGILIFVVVLLIAGTIYFFVSSSQDLGIYKSLLRGIDQGRALEIAAQLKSKGIETEIVPAETGGVEIQVREKQYDDAILEMAKSDLLLTDDFKLFDKTDWAASDYEKRVKYMRAIGGELSRIVSRMDGIRWGKVHVTIPPEKLFASRYIKDKTSASVTLELEPGRTLSNGQVSSILSLVSGYVPELEPSRISIIDTKGRVYSSAVEEDGGGFFGSGGNAYAHGEMLSQNIQRRVQDYLDGVVGAGKSKVVISAKYSPEKVTQNKTVFTPGAIGTHEYSEEALGDAAAGSPYTGTMNQLPSPRPVPGYSQSNGNELVDPRLNKDMPGNMSAQENMKQYPDASLRPDPYSQAEGLYQMGPHSEGMNTPPGQTMNQQGTPPMDTNRYVCAQDDEACKRNYRRHNFTIQSYPSYEQTVIESPAGRMEQIKVSVVVEKGSIPVSINQLKAGIAAAADPQMDPSNVEVVFRAPTGDEGKKKENKVFLFGDSSDGGFQWWWIIVILLAAIGVFLFFRFIGSLLGGKPSTPIRGTSDSRPSPFEVKRDPPPPSPSPFDRVESFERNTVRQPTVNQPSRPREETPIPDFEEETPKKETPQKNDLPFDLNDEFAVQEPTPPPPPPPQREENQEQQNVNQPPRQPNVRPRPNIVIEDDLRKQP